MKRCFPSAPWKRGCRSLLIPVLAVACLAGERAGADDLFSGFDDIPAGAMEAVTGREEKGLGSYFSGYAKLAGAYNFAHEAPGPGWTDWRGLSRLRAELLLEGAWPLRDWKLFASGKLSYDLAYALHGRDRYGAPVLDAFEKEIALRELYAAGALGGALDLKVGRQIVVWGRSDNFRVTDILNPLDNREPGLTDIEDLRLPLFMTRLDWYAGSWSLDLVAVHEHRFDKSPPFGHDFYPADQPLPPEERPAHTLANTEFAAELRGDFSGWDLSLYGARLYNDQPDFAPAQPVVLRHQRVSMCGVAMSLARGNFLYIMEAAHLRGLRFMRSPSSSHNRTDLLAGIEYQGFPDTGISLEYLSRHLHGYGRDLAASPEKPRRTDGQLALRVTSDRLHDTLHFTALLYIAGERAQHGAVTRLSASYDFADALSLTAGVALYRSGNEPYEQFGDNDRLFWELRFDF